MLLYAATVAGIDDAEWDREKLGVSLCLSPLLSSRPVHVSRKEQGVDVRVDDEQQHALRVQEVADTLVVGTVNQQMIRQVIYSFCAANYFWTNERS